MFQWSIIHCTEDIVFVIVHSYEKRILKNFKPSWEKWISLKLHKPQIQHFLAKKQLKKPKTEKKGDMKQIFMKLPYI